VAIGFRAKSGGDALYPNSATATITKPAGTVASDILIAVFSHGGNTGWTAPAGWTTIAANVGTSGRLASAFWAPGSVTGLTFSGTDIGYNIGWVCGAFTGVDATTPIDATGTTSTSTTGTIVANAVTVVTAQAWHTIAAKAWNAGTMTAPNFTTQDNGAGSAAQATFLLYNPTGKAAGSTGTVTLTASGSTTGQNLTAIPFALRPAAGAAPGPTASPAALLMAS
jgi:hypothetical protein